MDAEIKEVVQGDTPSLLDASKANEVIRALNAIRKLTVSPQGLGKITLGEKNAVLDLTPLKALFDQLVTAVSAFTTAAPPGGGGGSGGSSDWRPAYNALLTALADSSIIAACDPVTRAVTVTWNIDLPPSQ